MKYVKKIMPDDTVVPDCVLYAMKHYTLVYQALYMICQLSKMKYKTSDNAILCTQWCVQCHET